MFQLFSERYIYIYRYGLDLPGMEYRWRARFSAPVQTGPGVHPASCTMGTGSFPGIKRPGRGADHPPPSKCRGHERVELYLYSPSGPSWPVIGRTFTFTLYIYIYIISSLKYPEDDLEVTELHSTLSFFCWPKNVRRWGYEKLL